MTGRPCLLTPDLQTTIVSYIKAGMTPVIAAQAARVSRSTFYAWMKLGRSETPDPLYAGFVEAIEQAEASAIGMAEVRVYKEHPEKWLAKGPGRDRKGQEGWGTTPPQPETMGDRNIVVTLIIDDGVYRRSDEGRELPPGR